jgi:hypothetical protein
MEALQQRNMAAEQNRTRQHMQQEQTLQRNHNQQLQSLEHEHVQRVEAINRPAPAMHVNEHPAPEMKAHAAGPSGPHPH